MDYEDRERYRALADRVAALRVRIEEGESRAPLTREEARELLALLELAVDRLSPERWDRLMDTVADEAARRAGVFAPTR